MTIVTKETLGFQAEVKQLLNLMIHSLYSNKEIFLRELISNASDAADKLRFEGIAHPDWYGDEPDLAIKLEVDREARTITISDNGIGMSREDVINNLGTIARSGTKEFVAKLSGDQKRDAALIGQFGVGFYSAFIVADHIIVETRFAGLPAAQGVRWESDGSGEFTIETIDRPERGTSITLHLREGEDDFLNSLKLRSIIYKYSNHISLPIMMHKEGIDAANKERVINPELESVNQSSALWVRQKSEITEEQYCEFYKQISHDHENPLCYSLNRVEGRSEFTQLLFIPSRAPFDLWDRNKRSGIKLYVKRIFIMDEAEMLMPTYLRFIIGLIDSVDLPLNVSREILQESRDIKAIRESSTKRVLSMLEDLANSEDDNQRQKYHTFWTQFGQAFKGGIGEDHANQGRILKLLRFASTHTDSAEQTVSLAQYVSRMQAGQERIYYVIGETFNAAKNSPHLEVFRKKGVEVLLLSEPVDEWMIAFIAHFEGKTLASVARGGLDLGSLSDEMERKEHEINERQFEGLAERMRKVLGDKVKDVRVTFRLTDSPACLIADEDELSGNLLRILQVAGHEAPKIKPILEINPDHPLIAKIQKDENQFDDWVSLLFDQALLAEGGQLGNPASFVKRMNQLFLD